MHTLGYMTVGIPVTRSLGHSVTRSLNHSITGHFSHSYVCGSLGNDQQKYEWWKWPKVMEWPNDRITEWPSDRVTVWPSDRVTEWSSDRETEWQIDWATEWPSDWMTGSDFQKKFQHSPKHSYTLYGKEREKLEIQKFNTYHNGINREP